MIADYILHILAVVAVATYGLQWWSGIAFAGWAGDQSLVSRAEQPRIYWAVMLVQTAIGGLLTYAAYVNRF